LVLLGLICVQCTRRTEAFRTDSDLVTVVGGKTIGTVSPSAAERLETLAKTDQIALLKLCLTQCEANVQDYTCTLVKQERLSGKVGSEQWIAVKFLDEPFSVAMRWTKNAPLGDRVLYIEGKNNGNMLVRPRGMLGGIVGTVQRQPDGEEVMANTLRPVTLFGFERGLQSLIEVYELAGRRGDLQTTFNGYAEVDGRQAMVLERLLPAKDDYPAAKTLTYIDAELLLPVCIEAWNWDGQLDSRYVYKDLKINVGLKDADFTPAANGL
jgi:hypothetical protein